MPDTSTIITITLTILIVHLLVFLILRWFWCWYWKINKRIRLMEDQNKMLALLLRKLDINIESTSSHIPDREATRIPSYEAEQTIKPKTGTPTTTNAADIGMADIEYPNKQIWVCGTCGRQNPTWVTTCKRCGHIFRPV